jgi:hypothetical protein
LKETFGALIRSWNLIATSPIYHCSREKSTFYLYLTQPIDWLAKLEVL